MSTARESWEQPPQCLTHLGSQTQNSLAVDQAILARLVSQSSSEREKKRLARLQEEHQGAWVTAVPARVDGSDCSMSPQVFRTAVRYRLGLRVARDDVQCSFCMQPFDCYGDHAACCKRKADVIVRHNRIRNLVSRIAEEGLLSPALEKRGIDRPQGDVTLPCWKDSKGLAVDVAVTSPFSIKNLHVPEPADAYGARKHAKYDGGFVRSNFQFCAMVLETTGGYSAEGLGFLKQLFRFAARQQNTKLSVYAGRAWARLSCNLQVSVAQAILSRVPAGGQSPKGRPVREAGVRLACCCVFCLSGCLGGGACHSQCTGF
jgi:hypothetical protein